jgi:hypothetical protein
VTELTKSFKDMSGPLQRLELILGWKRPVLVHLLVVAAIAIPVLFFVVLAARSGWLEALAGGALSAITIVSGALAGLGPLWARIRDAVSHAPALINRLADAATKVRERTEERQVAEQKANEAEQAPGREEARVKTAEAMARTTSAADQAAKAEKAVVTARARADAARQAVAAAEARVADRAPERLLSRFVEERAASEEYQLGLPTRIRRDLDSLRDYLKNLTEDTKARRRADRVVLFIDDLDRCGPDVVVKVLEAVHILLSSNLFVVVVGVDVRWLTQALATHHADQFRDNAALDPEEFLEKIFQVPFWIPTMSTKGSEAIVRDALPEVRRTGTGLPPPSETLQPEQPPGPGGMGAQGATPTAAIRIGKQRRCRHLKRCGRTRQNITSYCDGALLPVIPRGD